MYTGAPSGIGREVLVRWNHYCSWMMTDAPPISSWMALKNPLTLARCGSGKIPSGGHGGGGDAIGGETVPHPPSQVFFNTVRPEGNQNS